MCGAAAGGGRRGGGGARPRGCLGGLPSVQHSKSFTYCRPGVHFNPARRIFRLRTPNCLYAFRISDSKDLEHLYYGRPLPLEDDLTYLARANVAAPFDPQPVSAAEALGLRELNDLTEGDQSQLAERWRSFSSQRGSEVGPDGVPLKPRRLENASWRIWGMRRSKGHSRLQLLPDGTVDEVQNDPGSSDGSLQRRATTGSSSPDPHRRASRGASGSGSSSSALPTGGGVAPPTGGLLSPDNLTPDGIVLGGGKANGDAGWAHRPSAAGAGGDGDDDDQSELVVPHPVSQSWVDAQASEEAERAAVLRQRRAQRKQQSLDRLVALSEATDGPADGERGDGGGAPEWLRPSAHEPRAADGSGAGGGGEPPVKRPGTPPCGEINWDVLDASPVGKNTKLLEFSDQGTGDYRIPSFRVVYEDGSTISPVEYESHEIVAGKAPTPDHTPTLRLDSDDQATTLIVRCRDVVTGLRVELHYTVLHTEDIISRRSVVVNNTVDVVKVDLLSSCHLDLDTNEFHMTQLSGAWARERQVVTKRLSDGVSAVESRRGASSHQHNPFVLLSVGGPPAEETGEAIGLGLMYSGSWSCVAEVSSETGRLRVQMGINEQGFMWRLEPGDSFGSPEVVMCYSSAGSGGISRQMHRLVRRHVIPPRWRGKRSPIVLNTWEATYFDVSHSATVDCAKAAAQAGIEMIVIDDGWFKNRVDAKSGLGDWTLDEKKFPFGLEALARDVHAAGLHLGIWVEPEMVSQSSRLYKEHPDWCLHVPSRLRTTGRNQLVLDFTRTDVRDNIFGQLSDLLSSGAVDFLKLDCNRNLTEVFSQAWSSHHQGEIGHRYIMGVYEVIERISKAYPQVLLETCSGGGGRFDLGMLYFSPQVWTSDNTDALSRVKIQWGTSLWAPASTMGAHVSTTPNHQTLRSASMKTRSLVAMCGTYGYELDPRPLSRSELAEMAAYVRLCRKLSHLVTGGDLYRLWDPFVETSAAWMYVLEGGLEAMVIAVNLSREVGRLLPHLRMRGLDPTTTYAVEELVPGNVSRNPETGAIRTDGAHVYQLGAKMTLSGVTLMDAGLPIRFLFDGDSVLFHLYPHTT